VGDGNRPAGRKASVPAADSPGPSYGTHEFTRAGDWSRGGQFAQGFDILDDKYKPAFLWVCENSVEPSGHTLIAKEAWMNEKGFLAKGEKSLNALASPWKAVAAFVNWLAHRRRGEEPGEPPAAGNGGPHPRLLLPSQPMEGRRRHCRDGATRLRAEGRLQAEVRPGGRVGPEQGSRPFCEVDILLIGRIGY